MFFELLCQEITLHKVKQNYGVLSLTTLFLIFVHKRNKVASLTILGAVKWLYLQNTKQTYDLQSNIELKFIWGEEDIFSFPRLRHFNENHGMCPNVWSTALGCIWTTKGGAKGAAAKLPHEAVVVPLLQGGQFLCEEGKKHQTEVLLFLCSLSHSHSQVWKLGIFPTCSPFTFTDNPF